MGDVRHEPSMEDILASIKRIIADDGSAAPPGPRVRAARPVAVPTPVAEEPDEEVGDQARGGEVLELTEAVQATAPSSEPEAEEAETYPVEPAPEPVAQAAPESAPIAESPAGPAASEPAPAAILSDEAALASRNAFAVLSAMVVQPEPGAPANTLEGLVREMLRPMLKEWLDANLPVLVETLVAKEIARISGRG